MKKPSEKEVKDYILECLIKKYGTYAGKSHSGELEIINDENENRIVITLKSSK